MTRDEFLTALDQLIAEKHLLKHPFYRMWSEGRLTLENLREYAISYSPHVAVLPSYAAGVHSGCDEPARRRELLENLMEEEGEEEPPATRWRCVAAARGADEADPSVERRPPVADAIE